LSIQLQEYTLIQLNLVGGVLKPACHDLVLRNNNFLRTWPLGFGNTNLQTLVYSTNFCPLFICTTHWITNQLLGTCQFRQFQCINSTKETINFKCYAFNIIQSTIFQYIIAYDSNCALLSFEGIHLAKRQRVKNYSSPS
jgi:hypothetical protein